MSDSERRLRSIRDKILHQLPAAKRDRRLDVVDLGCGRGEMCELWAARGDAVRGLDVDTGALQAAKRSAKQRNLRIEYCAGSAMATPWANASVDVCLCIELLEHIACWEACLDECARLLRPGGVLFITTTNVLCPKQQEFALPLYSWYPNPLKRHFERLAATTRPDLVRGTPYPAIHWFTTYRLRDALRRRGISALDRFDAINVAGRNIATRALVHTLRRVPPLRWLGHVATPYSMVLGVKG